MRFFDSLSSQQKEIIEKHLDYVIEANKQTNLTRIMKREEALVLHVEDSLTAIPEMEDAPPGLYGDLGSGAGYPGIPLAVATGRRTILVDAREKKMRIVEKIVEELGMKDQVKTFAGRAELLARKNKNYFAVITARALAKLPVLMELASPLLVMKGRLICFKANVDDDELKQANEIEKTTGMKLLSVREFLLEEEYRRTIIVFEKISKPTIKLPRKEGEAQNHPLTAK